MKAVFFDLDNTLYDYREYFRGAFKEISDFLHKKFKIPKQTIYKKMIKVLKEKTSFYPRLFNDCLKELGLDSEDVVLVKKIVKIFQEYRGDLKPYRDTVQTLKKLKESGYKLGIITDGNIKRQEAKVKMLGLEKYFDTVIYTQKTEPKPSAKPFFATLKKAGVNSKDSFYIGDNPFVDFKGAKEAGMKTIRLMRGEFKNIKSEKCSDLEIKDLKKILKLIK